MFGRLVARRGRSVEDGLQDAAHVADLAPDHVLSERAPKEEEESLGARLGRLLSSEELADVHLLVGVASGSPRLRVPAHRLLLAAASPVLRALLFSGEPCAELELPDSEPAAVLEFLRFVYTDHVTLSAPLAPQVLFLARRFHVTALQNHVDTFLRRALCGHNALAVWWSSRRLALTDWEALAMRVVRQFASEAFRSRHVTRLDESALLHVLQDDELRAPEAELFAGACRWAKNQLLRRGLCPTRALVREQMARALELIRFPLMTSDQIRSHVAPEGVLDDDTLRALLSQSRTWHAHQSRASLALNCCPRAQQRLERPVVTVQRFQSFDNQLPFAATWRALLFSVSRDVFVAGFGVHGPRRALPFDLEVSRSARHVTNTCFRWSSVSRALTSLSPQCWTARKAGRTCAATARSQSSLCGWSAPSTCWRASRTCWRRACERLKTCTSSTGSNRRLRRPPKTWSSPSSSRSRSRWTPSSRAAHFRPRPFRRPARPRPRSTGAPHASRASNARSPSLSGAPNPRKWPAVRWP